MHFKHHPSCLWGLGVTAFPWTSLPCLICNASPSATALCCICIVLPLHCLCKTATPPPPHPFPLSSLALLYLFPFPLVIPLSSVRLVPISRGLAVSCCADRAGRARTWLSRSAAAVVFEVKVAVCTVWVLARNMQ